MTKKVKFPLDMGNEVYVRTLEELKENYNSEKVTEYFLDGRLLTWLNDRYFDDEAEQVQELMEQEDKNNLAARLGKIFDIEIQDDVDIENLEIRGEKLDRLRQITADDEILENADLVAFSQEELGDLLDNEAKVIYLCGEKFRIPLSVKNVRYIGVNKPVISISGKGEIDLEASSIVLENCEFSEDTTAKLIVKKEDKDIVKHNDIITNKDPLHIEGNSDTSRVINAFVDTAKKKIEKADISRIKYPIVVNIELKDSAQGIFYIIVSDGKITVEPYKYDDYDVYIEANATEFMNVLNGTKNIYDAIADGSVKLSARDLERTILFINAVL